jgi:hypothetical protein
LHEYAHCNFLEEKQCLFSTSILKKAPFNLERGDPIFGTLKVQNSYGWSDFSEKIYCEVRVMEETCKVSKPRYHASNHTVEWDGCEGADDYVLSWDQGEQNNTFIEIEGHGKQRHMNLDGNTKREITFKLEAKTNDCGLGPPVTMKLERTFVPGPLECPQIEANGCFLSVLWKAPEDDGGSPVTEYQVTMLNGTEWTTLS